MSSEAIEMAFLRLFSDCSWVSELDRGGNFVCDKFDVAEYRLEAPSLKAEDLESRVSLEKALALDFMGTSGG